MSSDVAVSLKNVTKVYRKFASKHRFLTLKSALVEGTIFKDFNPEDVFVVLDNVSFDVEKGKTIGIIGENGAGKSTILKIIAGITKPNRGSVKVDGRVSALIELGAGFHPEISGRENIFINGIILGLSKKEIKEKFDEIVKFAELEDFIDQPVKTYSSGMFMRLGFSVAINVNPDILLVDEVLAVGDASFVPKCLDKINEFKREKKTIVFVSHDLETVTRITDEAIWIHKGKIVMRGYPRKVVDSYLESIAEKEEKKHKKEDAKKGREEQKGKVENRWGDKSVEIYRVRLLDLNGKEKFIFSPEDGMIVEMEIDAHDDKEDFVFGLGILNGSGYTVYGTNTHLEEFKPQILKKGKHRVRIKIPKLSLINGFYFIDLAVHSKEGNPYDYHHLIYKFRVDSRYKDVGNVRIPHEWEFSDGIKIGK